MILHGLWLDSTFHLWGVRSLSTPHEAVSADELRSALGDWCADVLLASVADEASISLWIPHPTGRGPDSCRRRITVPTLAFGAADTIDLLASLPSPAAQAFGDSVRYWSLLARYVLSILVQQQFVPDIEERGDGTFAALWRPFVHDRTEIAWLEHMAEIMPPVCTAAATKKGMIPIFAALRLVEDFIGAAVDALIRRIVGEDPFFDRVHEQARQQDQGEVRWLSALLSQQRVIRGDHDTIMLLADRIRTWVGRLDESTSAEPLRLGFTLLEPGEPAASAMGAAPEDAHPPWRLKLHLESKHAGAGPVTGVDAIKGGRIPIDSVWSEHGGRPTLLGRHLGHRRDQLLTELSRAQQACPLLDRLPSDSPPRSLELTTAEAQAFLRQWAPLLTARGFSVTLPAWASRTEPRLGMRLFVHPGPAGEGSGAISAGGLGLDGALAFDWRVAVGDVQLSLAEFEELVARGAPLVRYRDQWLEMDAEQADQALQFMRDRPAGRTTLLHALRMAYGAEALGAGLPILGLSGSDWIERWLRDTPAAAIEPLPQPAEFRGTLRPYQRRGLDWLAFLDRHGIGSCLADDMGLGKTIQLIALLLHEREAGLPIGPSLLFAPASVVGNWEREIERFTGSGGPQSLVVGTAHPTNPSPQEREAGGGLRVLVHHGPERLTGDAFARAAPRHDVVITTYALGYRDLDDLRRVHWHRIVLDEAQKVKNPNAGQTLAIRSIPAARRVALTGTPIENHLPELWSIMETLNPGLLGSAGQFRKRFVVPIEKLGDRQRQAQLRGLLKPFILRRSKSDPGVIRDLPEKMEMRVFCNLTPEQASLYQRTVDETLAEIETAQGIRRRGLVLAMLTRLKQVCNHPCHLLGVAGPLDDRSGKCERLVEMLEEVLAEGDAALVFTQYRRMGHLLERLMTERLRTEVLYLHGGTPTKRRDQMVQRFQDPQGSVRIFLLSLKAGGLGLNLTAANHVFHFDRWWNPAVEEQATDRVYRLGQTRRVQVHKFVCIGTVEDRIDRMLEAKRALADTVVERGDEWLTSLSTQELREYIRLSREAVG